MDAKKTRKDAPQLPAKKEATAPAKQEQEAPQKRMPIKTFREGDVSCSIWARTIVKLEPIVFYSITLERSYRNAVGEWKYTKSFNLDDLPRIVKLCQMADEFIRNLP